MKKDITPYEISISPLGEEFSVVLRRAGQIVSSVIVHSKAEVDKVVSDLLQALDFNKEFREG
jgi:hypothetical protein